MNIWKPGIFWHLCANYSADYLNDVVFRFSDFNSGVLNDFCSNTVWFIFICDRIWMCAIAYVAARYFRLISWQISNSYLIYSRLYLFHCHIISFFYHYWILFIFVMQYLICLILLALLNIYFSLWIICLIFIFTSLFLFLRVIYFAWCLCGEWHEGLYRDSVLL